MFGWFDYIKTGMTDLMNLLYGFTVQIGVPSYALAIIILTVIIKMALYPLSKKQMRSMVMMQKLAPEIKQIQDKYKGKDPQKMQQMIMELYKENNVNPMAGCLPLLIQMPILIALYRALYAFPFKNPAHAHFLWVESLSKTGDIPLAILAAATTYLQSRLTTNTQDQTQRTMLYMMPLFIGWIAYTVPAGLALYWVVFNIVGTIQQWFINKETLQLKEGVTGVEGSRKGR
ncbi:membrane protein insertase, YidC/Oxa1 family [Desulfotomaculum nigrificans CO-1-SRB]|uniref:Membrane protein insertase, YidC/Oxa1 family n=1 Tax=Desulfotomaculum nigrificans (strain DSM 14880 / VKM B-2319 / CO-1-SRB) TaxID=868595 RepID=F6B6T0_DESCC|nr:YidC/Oxa1 family membrane protein insertase [Desulfotomaculum nigrificans]AEF95561.1 membrane protein insertase, YidC/Oxa1 family [Desulfotomaculum nigrificans CO-1-SRB]